MDVQIGLKTEVTRDRSDQGPKWLHTVLVNGSPTVGPRGNVNQKSDFRLWSDCRTCSFCNTVTRPCGYLTITSHLSVVVPYCSLSENRYILRAPNIKPRLDVRTRSCHGIHTHHLLTLYDTKTAKILFLTQTQHLFVYQLLHTFGRCRRSLIVATSDATNVRIFAALVRAEFVCVNSLNCAAG